MNTTEQDLIREMAAQLRTTGEALVVQGQQIGQILDVLTSMTRGLRALQERIELLEQRGK